jgi:hypothetical protein
MKTPHSVETLTLWDLENGPIRQMVEIAFEMATDRIEREKGIAVDLRTLHAMHELFIPGVFLYVFGRAGHVEQQGRDYVLSAKGQKELRVLMEECIGSFLAAHAQGNASGSQSIHGYRMFHTSETSLMTFFHHLQNTVFSGEKDL